jgi:hypothetical protein
MTRTHTVDTAFVIIFMLLLGKAAGISGVASRVIDEFTLQLANETKSVSHLRRLYSLQPECKTKNSLAAPMGAADIVIIGRNWTAGETAATRASPFPDLFVSERWMA